MVKSFDLFVVSALGLVAIILNGCGMSRNSEDIERMQAAWLQASAARGYAIYWEAKGCIYGKILPNKNVEFGLPASTVYCATDSNASFQTAGIDACAMKAVDDCNSRPSCKGFAWDNVTRTVDMYDDSYLDPHLCPSPQGFAYSRWTATSQPTLFWKKGTAAANVTVSSVMAKDRVKSISVFLGDNSHNATSTFCGMIVFHYDSGAQLEFGRPGGRPQPAWSIPVGEYLTVVNTRSDQPLNSTATTATTTVSAATTSTTFSIGTSGTPSTTAVAGQPVATHTLYGCSFQTSAGTTSPWYGEQQGTARSFFATSSYHIVGLNTFPNTSVPGGIDEQPIPEDCINGWQQNASCVSGSWSYNGKTYTGCATVGDTIGWCPSCSNYSQNSPTCTYHYCASCSGFCVNGWLMKSKCKKDWMYNGKKYEGCTSADMQPGQAWCTNCSLYAVNMPNCDWSYCSICTEAQSTTTTTTMNATQLQTYQAMAAAAFAHGQPPPPVLYDDAVESRYVTERGRGTFIVIAGFSVTVLIAFAAVMAMARRSLRQSQGDLLLQVNAADDCYEASRNGLE